MYFWIDRVHSLPRVWSNRELSRFAHLFSGDIVNVSGWTDIDKEGRHYKDYFKNASSYTITNFESDKRGYQGGANEIFLDLTAQLPPNLHHRFDVVFNHTTLEHIFELTTAFSNLCQLSKDTVILVLPFLQQYHADYGDYWRLSPLAIKRLFELNDMELVYQSFNNHAMSSIYTFSIASRHPERWRKFFDWNFSCRDADWRGSEPFIGCRAIPNIRHRISKKLALWRIKR